MTGSNRIINFLKTTMPFSFLKKADVLWFADRLQEVSFPAGATVFSEGDRAEGCYFIESGEVDVILEKEGQERHLATLKQHDLFGEIALLTDSTRCVTIKAIKDCYLLELSRDDFHKLVEHSQEAFEAISDLVKERNRPYVQKNVQIFHEQTPEGDTITVISNPDMKTVLNLDKEGWVVWQQIDGTNSLKVIYDAYQKEFGKDGTKFVTELLAEFFDLGFIGFIFPEYTGLKEDERFSFWQRFRKKLEI